jgi:hypothetical protein
VLQELVPGFMQRERSATRLLFVLLSSYKYTV